MGGDAGRSDSNVATATA